MTDKYAKLQELRDYVLPHPKTKGLVGLDPQKLRDLDEEIESLLDDWDAALAALKEIDRIVCSHRRGAAGECQAVARRAIAMLEGRE